MTPRASSRKGSASRRGATTARCPNTYHAAEQIIEPDSTCSPVLRRPDASYTGECVHEASPGRDSGPFCGVLRHRCGRNTAVAAAARARWHRRPRRLAWLITAGMARRPLLLGGLGGGLEVRPHMPLNRQTQKCLPQPGQGVTLDRSTLVHWVDRAAWWLEGLYDLQLRTIHGFPRIFATRRHCR